MSTLLAVLPFDAHQGVIPLLFGMPDGTIRSSFLSLYIFPYDERLAIRATGRAIVDRPFLEQHMAALTFLGDTLDQAVWVSAGAMDWVVPVLPMLLDEASLLDCAMERITLALYDHGNGKTYGWYGYGVRSQRWCIRKDSLCVWRDTE